MLADHGLDHPALEYTLQREGTNGAAQAAAVQLQFSTNRGDRVMVRRSDEPWVSAVRSSDFLLWPRASWQLHDRHIWKFSIEDLAAVRIQQRGTNFKIVRKGDHQWSPGRGLKGPIEP